MTRLPEEEPREQLHAIRIPAVGVFLVKICQKNQESPPASFLLFPLFGVINIMPAKHYIDNEAKLIITTWQGDAVDTEFIEAIKKYQKETQLDPEFVNYNEVANFCDIASIKLTPNGLKNIGEIAAKTDNSKQNSKLAIVVTSGVAFNLARIYAFYRGLQKNSKKEIRIFKSEKEAVGWAKEIT